MSKFEGDDVHMSSYAWDSSLWRKPKAQRRLMIQKCRDVYPVSVYVLAVVELQRIWRGILLRRRVLKKYLHKNFVRLWKTEEKEVVDQYLSIPRPSDSQFVKLVQRVQARWRTVLLRIEFTRWCLFDLWPIYFVAAATIQRAWVDFRYVKRKQHHKSRSKRFFLTKRDFSASRIQAVWRGFVNRCIFKFYVQLIRYREQGDPALLLRAINPSESYMMDPAAGLHVRFRLGGSLFPPKIFYKIFTHKNVADICSFAPKDYVTERQYRGAKTVHNKDATRDTTVADRSRWYVRFENNEWRLVGDAMVGERDDVPFHRQFVGGCVTAPSNPSSDAAANSGHHHVRPSCFPTKRREARKRKEKQIRRKWLAELYSSEQVRGVADPRHAESLRLNAAALFSSLEEEEIESEIVKLRQWTEHLDFEKYRSDWLQTAVSAPTDALRGALAMPPVSISDAALN